MGMFSRIGRAVEKVLRKVLPLPKPPTRLPRREPAPEPTKIEDVESRWDNEVQEIFEDVTDGIENLDVKYEVAKDFDVAFVDPVARADTRLEARDDFFQTMRRYAKDISDFPWAAWRDWYETNAS